MAPLGRENEQTHAGALPRQTRDRRLDRALGAQIRREREHLGWPVAGLAERAGLEVPILTLIEEGEMRPTPRQLIQIAQSLGVSLSRLFFPK